MNRIKKLRKHSSAFAAAILFFLLVSVVLFSRDVTKGISHDEYQFIASAEFFRTKLLLPYVSYPFLHMPYMPVINGIFLFGSQADFLSTRVFNSACTLLTLILLFILVIQQSGYAASTSSAQRAVFGVTAVLLYITNPTFIEIDGRALNHAFPTLLSVAVFWLYQKTVWSNQPSLAVLPTDHRPLTTGHFSRSLILCGLLAGIATGVRLSYAVLLAPMLFAILFDPYFSARRERIRGLISVGMGFILALVPAGILALIAPRQFFYGNFHYTVLNTIYRASLGQNDSMALFSKLAFFAQTIAADPAALILHLLSAGFFITASVRWLVKKDQSAFQLVVLFAFSAALLAGGFAPTPSWPQYFFAPLPFIILGLFWGISLFRWIRPAPGWVTFACMCLALLANQPVKDILLQLRQLGQPAQWIPTELHQFSETLRAQAACPTASCKILTLVPMVPLEARLDSYPMFAVGSFSWRTAPILPKETREAYHIISYDDLDEFLAGDPPTAILTGTEADYDGFTAAESGGLDRPFVEYAAKNHYRPVRITAILNHSPLNLILWVK